MNIILATNHRTAGFSRPKVFAAIFALLILGDLMVRNGDGIKTILTWKGTAATPTRTNTPPVAPASAIVTTSMPPLPLPVEVAASNRMATVQPVVPRMEPKRVSIVSEGHGELIKATSDEKDLAKVDLPPKTRPRMTNPPPQAAHPPLPIAVP